MVDPGAQFLHCESNILLFAFLTGNEIDQIGGRTLEIVSYGVGNFRFCRCEVATTI